MSHFWGRQKIFFGANALTSSPQTSVQVSANAKCKDNCIITHSTRLKLRLINYLRTLTGQTRLKLDYSYRGP